MKKLAMRRHRALFGVAIVLAVGIGLFAAWPFLQYPGLPKDTDAELHVFRIAELGYSLEAGNYYPRWAPDFYHGYGYPIFNYYAPLTYHLGYALTLGQSERAEVGAKAVFILAHVVGAVGAYVLGRHFGGQGGGLIGAVAFSFAPYVQLINAHVRGDLAEHFAVAMLPWALWAWDALWQRPNVTALLAAIVTTTATFLSHNLIGLTALVLIGGLSLWRWLVDRQYHAFRAALMAAVAFVLLTAFFWLPFLLERRFIMLDVAGEGHYDFRNHFVSLRHLIAPVVAMDRRSTSMDVPHSIGSAVLILAFLGTVIGIRRRTLRALGPYLVLAATLTLLMTSVSELVWETLPGMGFFQFPWRFLGPTAALMVPLVATIGRVVHVFPAKAGHGHCYGGSRWRLIRCMLPALMSSLVILAAMPGLYPLPWASELRPTTPNSIVQAELKGRWRGTTSTNDFVPSTVEAIPNPEASVIASYANAQVPVDRVNRYTLPEGTTVEPLTDLPWVNRFAVNSETSFRLRLYLFDFPGWRAYIDGQEVPIELAHPEGFVTLSVPEGAHNVVVKFGSTPARTLGWVLSGLGIVVLGLSLGLVSHNTYSSNLVPAPARMISVGDRDAVPVVVSVAGAIVLLAGIKAGVFDPLGMFYYTSPQDMTYAADQLQIADLDGKVKLLGYDLSSYRVRPGDMIEVTLYWQAQREITQTYQSFVHMVYPDDQILGQSDHLNPGGFPTNLWPTDRYVRDTHRLHVPSDAPAGSYLILVGIYSLFGDERLPVRDATCGQQPDSVILCHPVTVRK